MGELTISTLEDVLGSPRAEEHTRVHTVVGLGTFRLRAFSLRDFHEMQRAAQERGEFDLGRWEILVLQHGIAEPQVTYDQAAQITLRPAYLVQELVTEIGRLSGLDVLAMLSKGAIDRAEASFRQQPAEVPDLRPGGPEGDDG